MKNARTYIYFLTGNRYKKNDIKILDMNGHLRNLDELKHLKRSDIICMLCVKGCSNEELNALCDKVSRLDDPIPLAAALDCVFFHVLYYSVIYPVWSASLRTMWRNTTNCCLISPISPAWGNMHIKTIFGAMKKTKVIQPGTITRESVRN